MGWERSSSSLPLLLFLHISFPLSNFAPPSTIGTPGTPGLLAARSEERRLYSLPTILLDQGRVPERPISANLGLPFCSIFCIQPFYVLLRVTFCVIITVSPSNGSTVFCTLELHVKINLGFQETAHLPLPQANINTYFSFRAKCWLRGGVGGQFPRNLN